MLKDLRPFAGSGVVIITTVVDWLQLLNDVICYLPGASGYNTAGHEIKRTPWEKSGLVY